MTLAEFNKKWDGEMYHKMLCEEGIELRTEFNSDCFEMYEHYGFAKTFSTPYDQMKEYNGLTFKVLERETTETYDIECLPAWKIEFEGGVQISALPEEITMVERYVEEYNEVHKKYSDSTAEKVREDFGGDITNDTDEYIDVNYKDILVTFAVLRNGRVRLTDRYEVYNEFGVFVDVFDV